MDWHTDISITRNGIFGFIGFAGNRTHKRLESFRETHELPCSDSMALWTDIGFVVETQVMCQSVSAPEHIAIERVAFCFGKRAIKFSGSAAYNFRSDVCFRKRIVQCRPISLFIDRARWSHRQAISLTTNERSSGNQYCDANVSSHFLLYRGKFREKSAHDCGKEIDGKQPEKLVENLRRKTNNLAQTQKGAWRSIEPLARNRKANCQMLSRDCWRPTEPLRFCFATTGWLLRTIAQRAIYPTKWFASARVDQNAGGPTERRPGER
jgi:hypothetical protein